MKKTLDRSVAILCLWYHVARSSSFLLPIRTFIASTGSSSSRSQRNRQHIIVSAVHARLKQRARGRNSPPEPLTTLRAATGSSKSSSAAESRSAASPKNNVKAGEDDDRRREKGDAKSTIPRTTQATTRTFKTKERTLEFELVPSIADIAPEEWDACLESPHSSMSSSSSNDTSMMTMMASSSPFLEHAWIRCLEESKCASPSTGWVPQHVRLRLDGRIAGFVPLYIKGHSLGEFIFDQPWADAAYQNGIDYYPKLLVGVPFTPATGPRVLWHPTFRSQCPAPNERRQLVKAVGAFLRTLARSNQLSSVHVNFLTDQEATDFAGPIRQLDEEKVDVDANDDKFDGKLPNGLKSLFRRLSPPAAVLNRDDYLRRTSLQYHWANINPQTGHKYQSFQEYLSCFKSKRRITIKRERATVRDDANVVVDAVRGRDVLLHDGLVERMFEIYKSTIVKMEWGRQYLTLDFFRAIANSSFVDNLCFLCARYKDEAEGQFRAEDVFAGTFNVIKDGVFYGRYWGCLPEHDVKNLHFEVCYWSAIEYCIEHGLDRMEPGAGGGGTDDYKWARGFDPALIHSVHYICDAGLRRGVAQFLDYETENNVEVQDYLRQRSSVAVKA